jgi:hypothetical protein
MRDFFKGWRRKVGCVTLVMACAVATGWLRSMLTDDYIAAFNRTFCSSNGKFYLGPHFSLDWRYFAWDSGPGLIPSVMAILGTHYSVVIVPLILLSAYLLLWKPRPKE